MSEPNQKAIDAALVSANPNSPVFVDQLLKSSNALDAPSYVPLTPNRSKVSEFADRYISLDALNAKEDGSDLAYIRILKFDNGKFGKQIFPSDSSTYKSFIVTGFSNSHVEKAQILKTNKTLQVYAFDSQPEVFNIQGVLKSTQSDRWDMAMLMLWDDLFRLTKLVQNNYIAEFGYESNIYWGYPLNFTHQKSSNTQYLASYSMQFLIIKRNVIIKDYNPELFSTMQQLSSLTK